MKLYFPRNEHKYRRSPARPTVLPPISDAALERHGARVLRPAEAVRAPGSAQPRATVYRHGVILIPEDVQRGDGLPGLDRVLGQQRLRLVPPPPLREILGPETAQARVMVSLPRAVGVTVAEGDGPASVDSWAALQWLRTAANEGRVARSVVERIGLDHLLVGANVATDGSPFTGDVFGTGPHPGLAGRIPVEVVLSPPDRRPPAQLGIKRRPVIAVVDSGIGDHPWLPYVDRAKALPNDEFVIVDSQLQDEIRQNGILTQAISGIATEPIDGYLDNPFIPEPLVGELGSHSGHGTFIAGLIRQLAPNAEVRAIRVMHSDGFAHESDVILALARITAEMERWQAGDPQARPVDIVSLSLGYFNETPEEVAITQRFAAAIDDLTEVGVTVVAAAGNFSTSREFYPAALATQFAVGPRAPMVSVGALNPNGTIALFSDEGPWVQCYASGVAMVSTYPTNYVGSVNPSEAVNGALRRRETLDLDDFSHGFAAWSGTSFSAPAVAAEIAAKLIEGSATDPALDLGDRGRDATITRGAKALSYVQQKWT